VQHIEDERKVLHALIVLGVLNSTHKKQRGVGGGGEKRCNTQQTKQKMLCTFGVLGVMDFGHKKHKVEGGRGVQHATYEKKCYMHLEF